MESIVNQETGEVYEIAETDQNNALVANMFTDEVLDMYSQYEALKQQKEMFEYKVRKMCEENGIKSVNNDYWAITYIASHKSRKVDTEKLKKAGIYEAFSNEYDVKESVRVRIK